MPITNISRKELIMDRLFKFLGILSVISLLALPLTGCLEGAYTLHLNVDTPRDGTTVNTSTVTVSGRVSGIESTGAKVSVNGKDVPVENGKFSIDVTLTEGKNVVNIDATSSGSGKLNEKVNVTYVPAKK
jgi:hypothetical protein